MPANKHRPDYILMGVSGLLLLAGILILATVSAPVSQYEFGKPTYFLFHQIVFGLIPGLILGYIVFRIPLASLKKWSPYMLLATIAIMVLVLIPKIGISSGGASRWIGLGPVSFQPSEFLKIFFILYLAAWLGKQQKLSSNAKRQIRGKSLEPKTFQTLLLPFFLILGTISLLLIFQPDIGTLGMIAITATLMYFAAATPIYHTIAVILTGGAALAILIKTAPYRLNRLLAFLSPDIDPMGIGYQIKQSLITIGSGGIFGYGLELNRQKFIFLPQQISDSIFSVFARETGFIGAIILISLFLIFSWQGFKIIRRTRDQFSQLAALGIVCWITLQAFMNIGSMVGIMPLTGIPLPFISYGGTALISEMIGLGILLNISRNT